MKHSFWDIFCGTAYICNRNSAIFNQNLAISSEIRQFSSEIRPAWIGGKECRIPVAPHNLDNINKNKLKTIYAFMINIKL